MASRKFSAASAHGIMLKRQEWRMRVEKGTVLALARGLLDLHCPDLSGHGADIRYRLREGEAHTMHASGWIVLSVPAGVDCAEWHSFLPEPAAPWRAPARVLAILARWMRTGLRLPA
jgi:hypothetical protein